ncbi:MAG: hypothetical protein KAQ84_03520, partial [Thermoplasmatales archaeon]|nr:hypothetical protein [Thermoplasmatales archaeon]
MATGMIGLSLYFSGELYQGILYAGITLFVSLLINAGLFRRKQTPGSVLSFGIVSTILIGIGIFYTSYTSFNFIFSIIIPLCATAIISL